MEFERRTELVADGVVSVPEAQQLTRLSRSELYLRMARGELPYVKLGKRRLIPRLALVDLLARGIVTGK